MVGEDDRPIGAPVLTPRRRDRFSVWVAEHRWAVPMIRLAAGLSLVAVVALVFPGARSSRSSSALPRGDKVGEREKERGDRLLETAPDSLPGEFAAYFPQPAATQSDGRYIRPRHM